MKKVKFSVLLLSVALILSGCGMSNTTKGTAIGAGGGAGLGALIGQLIGKDGKSTAIGAAIGTAVGGGAGYFIGKKMDKAKAEAEAIKAAQVESVTDANGLQAVKLTFDSGILFATNQSTLSAASKQSLAQLASVLKNNADADVAIVGHTDNTGSDAINDPLSLRRAQAVDSYLKTCGVTPSQIAKVEGLGSYNPIADNTTAAGRAQNRRVEVYMYASAKMIQEAQQQAQ